MAIRIIDACALTAYLRSEPGADTVIEILGDTRSTCLMHAVNLCEVYYDSLRMGGSIAATIALDTVSALEITVRTDMEPHFWQRVGQFKVNPGKLSLADCFALALAAETGGTLVTSDHHEFDPVASLALCPILFIR